MTSDQRQQLDMFPDSPEAMRIQANEATELRARIETILKQVATSIRPCKACGRTLYFVPALAARLKNQLTPYEGNGQNHFATCPKAAEFRKQ